MYCPNCGSVCYVDESQDGEFPTWYCPNCMKHFKINRM